MEDPPPSPTETTRTVEPSTPGVVETLDPFVVRDEDRGAGVIERVADLQGVVLVIERNGHQAHPEAGQVADDDLQPIRQEQRHPVTLLESHGCQTRCET